MPKLIKQPATVETLAAQLARVEERLDGIDRGLAALTRAIETATAEEFFKRLEPGPNDNDIPF